MGISIEVGTKDFDKAVELCEIAFNEPSLYKSEWKFVKDSRDFETLSGFLKVHLIDCETF